MREENVQLLFDRIMEVIDQNAFELIKRENDYFIVYLMNDAVESFVVLKNAQLTGQYDPDFEGDYDASIESYKDGYILIIYQGEENTFTVSFKTITMEVHCYQYSGIGHFWVDGYEYLRQLEYSIAIIRDKWDYLGRDYCNALEEKMALLRDFPPLSLYPSVPKAYRRERDIWYLDIDAWEFFYSIAQTVGDHHMMHLLRYYRHCPCKAFSYVLAWCLHRKKHEKVIDYMMTLIQKSASDYKKRQFIQLEKDEHYQAIWQMAKKELSKSKEKGFLMREEPFAIGDDGMTYKVHIVWWKYRFGNRLSHIVTYECKKQEK